MGTLAGINMYVYALNNPLNLVDPYGLDVIILNNPNGANGYGHQGIAIGNNDKGWVYLSQLGPANGGGVAINYGGKENLLDAQGQYSNAYYISTSPQQDDEALIYAEQNLNHPYNWWNPFSHYQCADLVSGALTAANIPIGDVPFENIPNDAYKQIKNANPDPIGHLIKGQ